MKKIFYFFILCISSAVAQKNSVETSSITCIPVASVCNPVTIDTTMSSLGIGITFVGLNQIQNPSASHSPTLEEFTCTDSTNLNIAQPYAFEVHTGLTYEETVTAWIDFSNDGAFNEQEIVFHDSGNIYMHTGFITIPTGTLNTFTPIRMRVGSDYAGLPSMNACDDLLYGHYEDYKIYYGVNIGVNDFEDGIITTVYPNPLHSTARITFSGNRKFSAGDLRLRIYNCFGALVSDENTSGSNQIIIERKSLPNGLYFYEVTSTKAEKSTGRFVVEF